MSNLVVAECPECGHEIGTEDVPQPLRLYVVLCALMVHAATIDTLMEMPEYEHIREGWQERIEGITEFVDKEASEMTDWGEAFDG